MNPFPPQVPDMVQVVNMLGEIITFFFSFGLNLNHKVANLPILTNRGLEP